LDDALQFAVGCLIAGARGTEEDYLVTTRRRFSELIDLFGKEYRKRFPGEDDYDVKDFCARLVAINEERNRLFHSVWSASTNHSAISRYQKAMRGSGSQTRSAEVHETDVLEFAKRMHELYQRFVSFVVGRVVARVDDMAQQ
jgi:hypothetical protein